MGHGPRAAAFRTHTDRIRTAGLAPAGTNPVRTGLVRADPASVGSSPRYSCGSRPGSRSRFGSRFGPAEPLENVPA
ncbi:hypothetical protein OG432_23800 [Streptomyces sp. NBC_00442]|uniref:hypothetical protein n=1 Tax=Streptomyces sp. NBC_00442 TaxID=2903651 RepID=UPI002E213C55